VAGGRIVRGSAPSLHDLSQGRGPPILPDFPDADGGEKMTKPIPDKAEIALEYPDKFYVGTFEGSSRFEAHLDPAGFTLVLERPGADDVRKSVHMHINFGLFAGILDELAATVGSIPKDDMLHRDQLARAVDALQRALARD
jgi:hypothetical protein